MSFLLDCFRKSKTVSPPTDHSERSERSDVSRIQPVIALKDLPSGFKPGVLWHTPFLKDNIMFGRFPFQDEVYQLQLLGVTMFLDLTTPGESYKNLVLTPYEAPEYVNFPIVEKSIPTDEMAFGRVMRQLVTRLQRNEKIYIHCKHGRGRSGMVALILVALTHSLTYEQALAVINVGHSYGHGSSTHWQAKTIPPHRVQQAFAHNFIQSWRKRGSKMYA